MTLTVLVALLFFPQRQPRDPGLAARVSQLLHTVLTTDDDKQKATAEAAAKEIFLTRGLPTIGEVGDEAAYEFVVLTCSPGPAPFRAEVLTKAKAAVLSRVLPLDAALYCETRIREGSSRS
jgi:hypothetical protein